MDQEAPDKLIGFEGHGLMSVSLIAAIVFPLEGDVVKLFDTPQLSGILHFQTLFFIIVRADITQRRM